MQFRLFGCFLSTISAIFAFLAVSGAAAQAHDSVRESGVAVPMRDGVVLRAEVWRPTGGGKFPTLVYRTPYGAQRAAEGYSIFNKAVERGYAVVIQDVRGRYASDGEFLPYQQEGRDGYDTIEWAARQPWSDGNIGTLGLSYPGAVQWLAAMERPPHLRAMVPAMTFSSPRNFFYSGGVFDLSWIGWIWNNIAPDVRVKKNLPGAKTGQEAREEFRKLASKFQHTLPLGALEELKAVAPWYFEWLRHELYDPWWDWAELRGRYDRARDVAVLNFSAWHDEAYGPEGAATNFNGLRAARRGQRDQKTQLVLGPWSHGVPGPEDCKVGQRDFCPAGTIDYDAVVLNWMDRYVRGIANGVDRLATVRYFVMGANEWREADQWPLPNAQPTPFYLAARNDRMDRGMLLREPVTLQASSTSFVSDPAHPVTDPHPFYSGANDYSELADRGDVLVFDSAMLEHDTEVTGPITAEIYLEVDAPDTDLWVRVLDLAPDGTAYNLMSPGLDVLRASYHNAAAAHHAATPAAAGKRELLQPGTVYKLVLPNLMTSNVFKQWHRIRVQISATFFPAFSRNLHTGQLESTSAEMRTATLRIHHDKDHPSRILLPVIPPKGRAQNIVQEEECSACEVRRCRANLRSPSLATTVLAEVVDVGPSPGFWSGIVPASQKVKYKVLEVLRGWAPERLEATHYVVANSRTADSIHPRLSPVLFSKGNRLILFVGGGIERGTWGVDENCGAIHATATHVNELREYIASLKVCVGTLCGG